MPSAYVSKAGQGTGISDDKVSSNDPYKTSGMHQKPVECTQASEVQIQCTIYQVYLFAPSLLCFGHTRRSLFYQTHTEKLLSSEEKGLWMAPTSLGHSCELEGSRCSDLREQRYPHNSQHVTSEALGLFVGQFHFSYPFPAGMQKSPWISWSLVSGTEGDKDFFIPHHEG